MSPMTHQHINLKINLLILTKLKKHKNTSDLNRTHKKPRLFLYKKTHKKNSESLPHLHKNPKIPTTSLSSSMPPSSMMSRRSHLKTLHFEFSLLAQSFIANNPNPSPSNPNHFFCNIDFKESQQSFALFGVNALPHICLIAQHQSSNQSE